MQHTNKLGLILILLFYCYSAYTQGDNNASQCYTNQTDSFWYIGPSYGSKKISNCSPSFNCHGYAIAYFESESLNQCKTKHGYNYTFDYNQGSCATDYFLSIQESGVKSAGSWKNSDHYFKVSDEYSADLIHYQQVIASVAGDHTSVKDISYTDLNDSTHFKYISKYGADGPLVSHEIDGSWYHFHNQSPSFEVSQPEYWAYISGFSPSQEQTLQAGSSMTFSFPLKNGLSYSWTLNNSGASIIGSNSSNKVKIEGNYGSTVVLTGTVTGVGNSGSKSESHSVTINVQSQNIYGSFSDNNQQNAYLNTVNFVTTGNISATASCGAPSNSVNWSLTSGSTSFSQSNNSISFNMPSGGSMSFQITASCGGANHSRNVTFYNIGGFMVYPNPSSNELYVDTGVELNFELEIVGIDNSYKSRTISINRTKRIDVNTLKKGNYAVRLFYRGNIVSVKKIIVNK